MKEIKFRGKRIDTREWIYGDLIQDKTTGRCAIVPQIIEWLPGTFEVIPESICQYTGDQYEKA